MNWTAIARQCEEIRKGMEAAPLHHYNPAPVAARLKQWFDDPAVSEVLIEGANRVSKSQTMAAILAGGSVGTQAAWAFRRRPRWIGKLVVAHIASTHNQARGDSLKALRYYLPAEIRAEVTLRQVGLIDLPEMEIHTIGWVSGLEKARARLQGLGAHILWVNEECPPELFEEGVPRGAAVQGIRVVTATLGLEISARHAARLDSEWFLKRARRGPHCGHPKCVHTGENNPGFRHAWLEYNKANTPWLTAAQRRAYIDSLPEESRNIRLGLDRGRIVSGRCWWAFDPADHAEAFTLADIADEVGDPSRVELWLVQDCGKTDSTAAGMLAVYRHPCEGCAGTGSVECKECRGRGARCGVCRGAGSVGCFFCEGLGEQPEVWILGSWQSKQHNTTDDNARDLRQLAKDCGIVDRWGQADFGPKRWDAFIGDNMMAKQYPEAGGELQALRQRLGNGLPHHQPANKMRSFAWSFERGNHLLRRGRCHVHPRCKSWRDMAMSWAWGKDGREPEHDGPQGVSHTDAWWRYAVNAICAPKVRVSR